MARTDLEQLVYSMDVNIQKLTKKLNKAVGETDAASGKIERRIKRQGVNVGKALDNVFDRSRFAVINAGAARIPIFGSALEALGPAGLAGAAGIAAVAIAVREAREAIRFVDELADTADRLHVTTDALQEYRYAIRAAGGEEKGADDALEQFGITLGKAQAGLSKAKKGFKELGFSDAEIKSWKSVEEAVMAVSARIAQLKSNPQKDAVIDQLGLTGIKQLVDEGPAGMRRYMAAAHDAGNVMDNEIIARAKDLNDELETAQKRVDVELKSSFVGLGPALVNMLNLLGDVAELTGKIADDFRSIENRRTDHLKDLRQDFVDRQKTSAGRMLFGEHDRKRIAQIDAVLAKRAAENVAPPPPKGGRDLVDQTPASGPTAAEKQARGQDALDQALRAQLRAQSGLTDDVEQLARLKIAEVDADLDRRVHRLQADIDQGKIDAAMAQRAITMEKAAAEDEKALIRREAEDRLQDVYFDRQRRIGDIYDQIGAIEASMAKTVQARLDLERRTLAARQRQEREELDRRLERDLRDGRTNQSAARDERAALADRQAAEVRGLQTNAVRDLAGDFRDGLQTAVDALRGKADVMEYLADRFQGRLLDNFADWMADQALKQGGGNIFSAIAGMFGFGRRAAGGPVGAGQPYLVGERGPEMIIPGRSGTVIPNHVLGTISQARGGTTVHLTQNIDAKGAFITEDVMRYVDAKAAQAINIATAQSVSASMRIVPAKMGRSARRRVR